MFIIFVIINALSRVVASRTISRSDTSIIVRHCADILVVYAKRCQRCRECQRWFRLFLQVQRLGEVLCVQEIQPNNRLLLSASLVKYDNVCELISGRLNCSLKVMNESTFIYHLYGGQKQEKSCSQQLGKAPFPPCISAGFGLISETILGMNS